MLDLSNLLKFDGPLLICGETGSGKTTLAKKIHQRWWKDSELKPFLSVNVASLSEGLLERELFGNLKGAYTGADRDRPGFFTQAYGGTLFLDEIGDISLEFQAKLLTVIESGDYFPVGSCQPLRFRGKLILATHQDLESLCEQGKFRYDLFYRIRNVTEKLSALRDNPDLLNTLVDKFHHAYAEKYARRILKFNNLIQTAIRSYSWPGNIRELKALFDYVYLFSSDEEICLPEWFSQPDHKKFFSQSDSGYKRSIEIFERDYLWHHLKRNNGKINKTSQQIGLNKVTLISKIKKYDLRNMQKKMV